MFSELEYATVIKFIVYQSTRVQRKYQLLFVKFPNNKFTYCFKIAYSVKMPELDKGDTVKLKLDLYTRGKSTEPQYKVVAVIKLF